VGSVSSPGQLRKDGLSLRDGYALAEIARRFEVSPGRISQIKKQAIIRLRIALGSGPGNQPRLSTRKTLAMKGA